MKKLFFIFLFLSSINLFAHRVDVFPYIENGKIVVEGYFSDGTPARNSKVEIYNEKGEKITEGKTNEKGFCSFPIPENSQRLKIVLIASMGHRAEIFFSSEEKFEDSSNEGEKEEVEKVKKMNEKLEKDELEKAVEKAIKPLIKMMEKERRKTRISDVIGGIGYILGIFGLIALLYKRK